jgi:uncharacterized repeat protein (TIGR01451 family)
MISVKTLRAAFTFTVLIMAFAATPALAADAQPSWSVSSLATPTAFVPGDTVEDYSYDVRIANFGGAPADGSDITIIDTLPAGVTVESVNMFLRASPVSKKHDYGSLGDGYCETDKAGEVETVTCTISEAMPEADEPARVQPSEERRVIIHVDTPASTPGGLTLTNHVEVQGGGAPAASTTTENLTAVSDSEGHPLPAPGGLSFFRPSLTELDGQPTTQAGSHPYQVIPSSFAVHTKPAPPGSKAAFVPAGGDVKDVTVTLPRGMAANPTESVAKRCTAIEFTTVKTISLPGPAFYNGNSCPEGSAVGMVLVQQVEGTSGFLPLPLYNLVPPPGMPAQFGFQILNLPFYIDTEVRPDQDYRIVGTARNLTQIKRLTSATLILWGTPADPRHDALRGSCLNELPEIFPLSNGTCSAGIADPKPLFRMPTSCAGTMETRIDVSNWTTAGELFSQTDTAPAPSGCNQLEFEPTLEARPTTDVADSPTGLHALVHIPQNEEPDGLGTADLRETVVTLPKGIAINPASANGLAACSPGQVGLTSAPGAPATFSAAAAQCPEAARIGSVEINTPAVDHPLKGGVYVAAPHDNPFNTLLALYIAVDDAQSGVVVKLAGEVEADPVTGQLTTTFAETPQQPFEDFKLDFFGGAAAALRTPPTCGTYTTTSTMTPWSAPESGPPATPSDTYSISKAPGGSCAGSEAALPHAPSFNAGTIAPIARAYSPFVINLRREDGSQEFGSLTVTPPPGLLGKLAGIPYCPEGALLAAQLKTGTQEKAAPSCPASSRVGTVDVGAGAGPAPYYTQGAAYLAGPYKGAPLSLAIVTPATAGPYDLGTVVVRTALKVDPETTRITAVSDPIPHILQGIPLDVRSIAVKLDRPSFTLNPTSCDPMAVTGQAESVLGQVAPLSQPFQVGECGALDFKPKLSLRLKGGTKRSQFPALTATLMMPEGGANIARASVALPHSEFLEQGHIGTICTRVQFAANACPAASVYGSARAFSPLLDKPVEGPVYLRSSNNPLPDLVADLNGQIHVALAGRIDTVRGGIRTTFEGVPDAPVSKFVLSMKGGKKSLLVNSRDICKRTSRAVAEFDAQNGKVSDSRPKLVAKCKKGGGGGHGKKKPHKHGGRASR